MKSRLALCTVFAALASAGFVIFLKFPSAPFRFFALTKHFFASLAAFLRSPGPYPPPSPAVEAAMRAALKSAFGLTSGVYGSYCMACPQGDAIGALVRLAFHDSAGGGGAWKAGGPNGCIDDLEAANKGLVEVRAQLDAVRSPAYEDVVSRADFFNLAAVVAREMGSTVSTASAVIESGLPVPRAPLRLPWRTGRIDDETCAGLDAGRLPSAAGTWAQTAARFIAFGMSATEVVAILGAHSLGRCQAVNSGFEGGWTQHQSSFSNEYFRLYVSAPWTQAAAGSDVWIGAGTAGGGPAAEIIMLRSDIQLGLETKNAAGDDSCQRIDVAHDDGAVPPSVCPHSAVYERVLVYAADMDVWLEDYAKAWPKMTEFGYSFNGTSLVPMAPPA